MDEEARMRPIRSDSADPRRKVHDGVRWLASEEPGDRLLRGQVVLGRPRYDAAGSRAFEACDDVAAEEPAPAGDKDRCVSELQPKALDPSTTTPSVRDYPQGPGGVYESGRSAGSIPGSPSMLAAFIVRA